MNLNDRITSGGLTVIDSIQTELTPLTPNLKRFKESDVWLRLYDGTEINSCMSFLRFIMMRVVPPNHWVVPENRTQRRYLRDILYLFIYDKNSREASGRKVEIISRGQNYTGENF